MENFFTKIFFLFILSVFVANCSDDADFSSSSDLSLEFSSDTVSFDTVFTGIGSSTASFLVYNRNSSSLRIDNVKLAGGENSSFRVNVDGQYGCYISDLEIRKNDSIFVFVDVNVDKNDSDIPLIVTDSLVFALESGIKQSVIFVAYGRDAEVLHAPVFDVDTVLESDRAYIIYDSLTIASGCTLTLPAGCELYFHNGAGMNVYGSLKAIGEQERPVLFRGDRTDCLFDYLPYDRVPGQWEGIVFHSSSNDNILDWCDIHSAEYGLLVEAGDTALQRLTVSNSSICNFSGNALESVMSRIDVTNSLIANAGGNCVKVIGGNVSFIHCTIANFYVWKQRDVAVALYNTLDGKVAPLYEAFFANCIITGSKSDEIMGYFSDLGDSITNGADYRFVSSLLNTKPDDGNDRFLNIVWDDKSVYPFAKEHFRLVDNSVYMYDFRLDSLSAACGIADKEYSRLLPVDLDGNKRPDSLTDAGCYQYVFVGE